MSDTQELVLMAEPSVVEWRSEMQKRHESEMRAMKNQMRDEFTESMVKLAKEERALRKALDEAETQLGAEHHPRHELQQRCETLECANTDAPSRIPRFRLLLRSMIAPLTPRRHYGCFNRLQRSLTIRMNG